MKKTAFILAILTCILTACRTKKQVTKDVQNVTAIEVHELHDTVYKNIVRVDTLYKTIYKQDSLFLHDSIYQKEYIKIGKTDTVTIIQPATACTSTATHRTDTLVQYKYVEKLQYKDRIKYDTIYRSNILHDTAYITKLKTDTVTRDSIQIHENEVTKTRTNFLASLRWLLFGLIAGAAGMWVLKERVS